MPLTDFLSLEEQLHVVDAIVAAEKCTSGEIRVHMEPQCKMRDAYKRAIKVFNKLKMYKTRARNAVLIYVAFESHNVAIIGDKGINAVVPSDFWNEALAMISENFTKGAYANGLCNVIELIGNSLAQYFPHDDNDVNEQSDEISFSE